MERKVKTTYKEQLQEKRYGENTDWLFNKDEKEMMRRHNEYIEKWITTVELCARRKKQKSKEQ